MNLLSGKPGRILLTVALAVLLANSVASWWSIDKLADHDAWLTHSHEVLSELKLLLPTLAKANDSRLPSDAAQAQPLPHLLTSGQALVRAGDALARLQELTKDNEGQQQRLASFRFLVEDHFRTDAPPDLALRYQEWLAETNHLLDEMESEERRLLEQRDRQSRGSRRLTLLTQALTTALAVTVLGVIVGMARRAARNQEGIERQIRLLNKELERRVLERTRELAAANEGLHRAKEDAESSQRRTQLIVDSAHDAYVAMDANGLILDWNRQAEQIFGWPREAVVGQPLHDLIIPPRSRAAHVRGVRHFLATGEGPLLQNRIEVSALHRAGREFPVEMTISPLRVGDDWIFSAFLHDISERKRAEEDLRQAKEAAEAANRTKSDFLANMSHEIRTPMNGILGMAEVVLDTNLSTEQREYIATMQSSAQSLLIILNDILDFSKIEAGKLDLDPEPFLLRDRLGDTLKPLAVRAYKKGVELALRVAADVPDRVTADWGRLQQILVNLIGNAIKFTSRGEVIVTVRLEESGAGCLKRERVGGDAPADLRLVTPDRCFLHFEVIDSGIGIPKEKLGIIFTPFEQADGSMARKFGGTGLGLTISSRLVELMGGRLWVESEVGRGSTFHFTARLDTTPGSNRVSHQGLVGISLLVVDDSAISRDILGEMLDSWGMRPTLTATMAEARAALDDAVRRGQPFDVLLLDAELPAEEIRSLVRQANLPEAECAILLLPSTGYRTEDAEASLKMSGRVPKPIKPSDLLGAIQQGMSRRGVGVPCRTSATDKTVEPALSPLRVLMAEDNVVNQRIVVLLLEKQGHSVVLANNGREALAAMESKSFDLVLMDVQMPELDGFETTAELRRREAGSGRHTPIIALTAHAMKGDRERCLAAGMDGYISKPIQARQLLGAIREVLSVAAPAPPVAPSRRGAASLDPAAILERLGGDREALREVAELFRQDTAQLLVDLDTALAGADAPKVRRSAHSLKGSAGLFGAEEVTATAQELERMGQDGDLSSGRAVFERLSPQVEALFSALASLETR